MFAAIARAIFGNANDRAAALPAEASTNPGLAFERAAYLRRRGLDSVSASGAGDQCPGACDAGAVG